jgi:hypothetical protein
MSNIPPVESAFGELKPRNSTAPAIPLIGRTVIIGSSATSSDISLSQPGIHPQHCRFSKSGRSVMLEDLSSGTMLNGQAVVGRTEIRTGDVLTLGTLECEFANLIPSAASAAPAVDTINDIDAFTFESSELPKADVDADTEAEAEAAVVWYAEALGRTLGPMSEDELVRLVQSGGLTPLDLVHNGDSQQAKPCGTLSFLAKFFADRPSDQQTESKVSDPASTPARRKSSVRSKEADPKVRRKKRKKKRKAVPHDEHPAEPVAGNSTVDENEQSIDDIMNDVLLGDEPDAPSSAPVSPATFTPRQASTDEVAARAKSSAASLSSNAAASSAIQAVIAATEPAPSKPAKKKKSRQSPGLSFNFNPGVLKVPAMVVGGLAALFAVYSLFLSAPIDRSAAIEQISKFGEEIKSARAAKDQEQLDKLARRLRSETSEIVDLLVASIGDDGQGGHETDRSILLLIRMALPTAIRAPMDQEDVIGTLETQSSRANATL